MQKVIDLVRQIRERHNRPVKMPFKELTVVHPDAAFLNDLTGVLEGYVEEEVNVRTLTPCNDLLKFATLRAEPDWSTLGKRLGRAMAAVGKAIKALTQEEISRYDNGEALVIEGHTIAPGEMSILHDFKAPEGSDAAELDAAGDGELLVVVDLSADEALLAAGTAREVVNRVQKLRKKAGLSVTDIVEVFLDVPGEGEEGLWSAVEAASGYVLESVGVPLRRAGDIPDGADVLAREDDHAVSLPEGGEVNFAVVIIRGSVAVKLHEQSLSDS